MVVVFVMGRGDGCRAGNKPVLGPEHRMPRTRSSASQQVGDHLDRAAGVGPDANNDQMPPNGDRPTLEERRQLAKKGRLPCFVTTRNPLTKWRD